METLPFEVIELIFLGLSDISTASNLGRTSKGLHKVWTGRQQHIARVILEKSLLAYNEALMFTVAIRFWIMDLEQCKAIDLRYISSSLRYYDQLRSKVCQSWRRVYAVRVPQGVWSDERAARHYYRSRLLVVSHDYSLARKTVRKLISKLPYDEVMEHQVFIEWWVLDCKDQRLRDMHDMGTTYDSAREAGFDWYDAQLCLPERWMFATEGVAVIARKRANPSLRIGPSPGLWSDLCGYGYTPGWE